MNSYSLLQEIKKHPWVLVIVIAFHLGLAVLLGINLINTVPEASTARHEKIINAVAVNADKFYQREKQKKQAQEAKKKQQTLKRKREAEKKKQRQIKKAQARQEKLRQKRLKQEKIKKAKIKKEKARQQKIITEKKRQQVFKKEQQRLQQKKIAEEKERMEAEKLQKQKLAAEAKRKQEAKRRAEAKAEIEQAIQTEENERLQAERAARLQSLRAQYVKMIARKVENNWLRPPDSKPGQSCNVVVTQTITGDVIEVRLQSCHADNLFQRSVERAVRKASPLPMPPSPEVFDRKIYFTFKPQ